MIARLLAALLLVTWPLQSLDDAVARTVQGSRAPALEPVARAISDRSRPALALAAVTGLLVGGAARVATVEGLVVLLPVNLAVEGLKRATFRARPDGEHRRSNAAFPSSHAANAFAVATVLARRWKRATLPAFALASLVGWSRLYLNRHWLSDVAVGAALGVGLAMLVLALWQRGSTGRPRTAETA
ncbi:MAG: phosphatase PAP2 family protein [Candidatus Eisenbacteria bacterium]|nr:phosphatase PAP2 family protein [Candidatus Eisenbacteria bacterium]